VSPVPIPEIVIVFEVFVLFLLAFGSSVKVKPFGEVSTAGETKEVLPETIEL
jgi:hypothetical protein